MLSKAFPGCVFAVVLGVVAVAPHADELHPEMIPNLMPYRDGLPTHPVATPGATIDASNVDEVKELLVPMLYDMIRDGTLPSITVTKTRPVEPHPKFVEATAKNIRGSVKFDSEGINAVGFEAGRPFPFDPDPADPQAGLKLLWNFRYSTFVGDSQYLHMAWRYKDMRKEVMERELITEEYLYRHMNRMFNEPVPEVETNPSRIFSSVYLKVTAPFDVRNTQLLIHVYEDDSKRNDAWLYLGFQRRVRRLATGQVTDAFLGTDLMIEDFFGYNTRISEYEWEYLETKYILAPVYDYDEALSYDESLPMLDDFPKEGSTGRAKCFPDVPYSLRKVYVIDGKPKDQSHPLSLRKNFLDVETAAFLYSEVYDRKGEKWKLFTIPYIHPDSSRFEQNHGTGAALWSQPSQIDIQAQHCTTLHFHVIVNDPAREDASRFTVQHLRESGR